MIAAVYAPSPRPSLLLLERLYKQASPLPALLLLEPPAERNQLGWASEEMELLRG